VDDPPASTLHTALLLLDQIRLSLPSRLGLSPDSSLSPWPRSVLGRPLYLLRCCLGTLPQREVSLARKVLSAWCVDARANHRWLRANDYGAAFKRWVCFLCCAHALLFDALGPLLSCHDPGWLCLVVVGLYLSTAAATPRCASPAPLSTTRRPSAWSPLVMVRSRLSHDWINAQKGHCLVARA
jgi:hypothetical protein